MTSAPQIVVHVSSTDWPTLALAAAGTALAIASLAWQWYSTVLAGSRLRVAIEPGLRGVGGVVTFPETLDPGHLQNIHDQGYTEPVLAVHVNNTGRGATSIASVELSFSDGGALKDPTISPALPLRLDGEHDETWYFPLGPAVAYAQTSLKVWPDKARNMRVRGRVKTGSDKTVVSKSSVPLH